MTRYDTIGRTYAATRRTEPRIAAQLHAALGDAASVVNVGAGTGNYEPDDRFVVACDPSRTMIGQRAPDAAPAIQAVAEALPFADHTFDAALAVLTVHHWSDVERGLREVQRVSRRQVLLYFETSAAGELWLIDNYFPEVNALHTERTAPDEARMRGTLHVERVEIVPVPDDCADGFGGGYWNRPERYLDPEVQAGISGLAQLDPEARARGTARLRADLESGAWDARFGHLRSLPEIDLGYRILVARSVA